MKGSRQCAWQCHCCAAFMMKPAASDTQSHPEQPSALKQPSLIKRAVAVTIMNTADCVADVGPLSILPRVLQNGKGNTFSHQMGDICRRPGRLWV